MRTTLDLDDDLMRALLERFPGVSKTEAIERAIKAFIDSDAVARARALAGRLEIEDVSAAMRKADRRL